MDRPLEEILQKEIGDLLRPFSKISDSPAGLQVFASSLGWNIDALSGLDVPALNRTALAVKGAILALLSEDSGGLTTAVSKILGVRSEIARVADLLSKWSVPQTLPPDTGRRLLEDFAHGLFDTYLSRKYPRIRALLILIGIIELKTGTAINADNRLIRRETLDARLRFDKLAAALQDPLGHMETMGHDEAGNRLAAEAMADIVLPLLGNLLDDLGFESSYGGLSIRPGTSPVEAHVDAAQRLLVANFWLPTALDQEEALSLQRIVLGIIAAPDGSGPALLMGTSGSIQFTYERPSATASLSISRMPKAVLIGRNGVQIPSDPDSSPPSIEFQFVMPGTQTGKKAFLVGSATAPVLSADVIEATLSLGLGGSPDLNGSFSIRGLRFSPQPGERDSFISQNVSGTSPFFLEADISFAVSLRHGLQLNAGLAAEKTIEDYIKISAVRIGPFSLGAQLRTDGVVFTASTNVRLALGPVTALVEGLGIQLMTKQSTGLQEFGPVAVELGLSGPKGVGLSIDTSVVVGGGYLFFDKEKKQYGGVVHLEIAEFLSITAIGLITTEMPDGSPGFSLLVLIAVEFVPPIQLGYGFTLNGVGGLLGVNRTVLVDVIRSGLRAGTLGSILFPQDPIANAPKIISDLNSIFPPAVGRFLFGPMAILGWGPKSFLLVHIALILELPAPIRLVLLGRLKVFLPEEKTAVVRLQLDALGIIEFGTGDISLEAALYDSEIVGFTITGGMVLRANVGLRPEFLLAVGGFHPAFQPPPAFPAVERLAISLATGDNPRFRVACYFALTTNTVQFGALLELYVAAGPFSVEGRVAFDALIQFNPFGFMISMEAMVAVKAGGNVLLAVGLALSLTGPTPWRFWGKASFRVLLIEASVNFDVTLGEEEPPPQPPPVDIRPLLVSALEEQRNWGTQLPIGQHPLVVQREQTQADDGENPEGQRELLVHPLADLHVTQQVVPLGQVITRFGATMPEPNLPDGSTMFTLTLSSTQTTILPRPIQTPFPPAQFRTMSDEEKLAAPAFESFEAGFRFGVPGFMCGHPVVEEQMEYEEETVVRDHADQRAVTSLPGSAAPYVLTYQFVQQVATLGSVGRARLYHTGRARYQEDILKPGALVELRNRKNAEDFAVRPRRYKVVEVDKTGVTAPDKKFVGDSYAQAKAFVDKGQRRGPWERPRVVVIEEVVEVKA